jgi:hypothetical protein
MTLADTLTAVECRSKILAPDSRFQTDRGPPAAAEGPVGRVAGSHRLLRLLGPTSAFVAQVNGATSETLLCLQMRHPVQAHVSGA